VEQANARWWPAPKGLASSIPRREPKFRFKATSSFCVPPEIETCAGAASQLVCQLAKWRRCRTLRAGPHCCFLARIRKPSCFTSCGKPGWRIGDELAGRLDEATLRWSARIQLAPVVPCDPPQLALSPKNIQLQPLKDLDANASRSP
jgi:hypothetical protein